MKKLYACVIAIVALSLASCSKERTCTCTYTDKLGLQRTYVKIIDDTKSKARKECSLTQDDIAVTQNDVSCSL